MQKKQNVFIVCLTVAVVVILVVFIGTTITYVNTTITQACYDNLENTSKQLAVELANTIDMDRTILSAMAAVIAAGNDNTNETLCEIMRTYNSEASFVSYVELLRPDNTILDSDGTVRSVSGSFDFAADAARGSYVSEISDSTRYAGEKIVRNSVPVVKNGETIYVLYGVVRLSDLAQRYTTNIYDGNAYVYLIDGNTGDFLLDTWHKSLGNISDFSERKMVGDYSFDTVMADMRVGKGGNIGFVSETTGQILFMHYEPVAVNNWSVIVTVEKQHAMRESEAISGSLYKMAAVVGGVMFVYMSYMLYHMFREYRHMRKLGMEDQATGLQNRNAYDSFTAGSEATTFGSIACIYVDANGLHEINNKHGHIAGDKMLLAIADALKAAFGGKALYRIGGDEFVVFCENEQLPVCEAKMKAANEEIEKLGYSISYGIAGRTNETGIDRVTREADKIMLENKKLYYAAHERRNIM